MLNEVGHNATGVRTVRIKYVDTFIDRNGNRRYYFRRGKGARWVLPGTPASPEFEAAYAWAVNANHQEFLEWRRHHMKGGQRSFNALAQAYYRARAFRQLTVKTQQAHQRTIDRLLLRTGIGLSAVDDLTRSRVARLLERLAPTPTVANDALRTLRLLIWLAIAKKWQTDDPTLGIAFLRLGNVRVWTAVEVASYQDRWPPGTRQRTAMALFQITRHRCAGVAAMTWAKIEAHPARAELETILGGIPHLGTHALTTYRGMPFSAKGLGNFMAVSIRQAGLPSNCIPDGLRKTFVARLETSPTTALRPSGVTPMSDTRGAIEREKPVQTI